MVATFSGGFNDNPWWASWGVTIDYDTEFGTRTRVIDPQFGAFDRLVWDAADGGRSPGQLLSVSLTPRDQVYNWPDPELPPPSFQTFTGFTHFEVSVSEYAYDFNIRGPTLPSRGGPASFGMGFIDFGNPNPIYTGNLDDSVSASPIGFASYYAQAFLNDSLRFPAGAPLVYSMSVRPGSVAGAAPEPSTWSLMLVAFGLLGVALRRRSPISHRGA